MDVKSLYQTAKYKRSDANINAFQEACYALLESPVEYLQNIEYIIKSNYTLPTLEEFVGRYGVAIPAFNPIYETVTNCIDLCNAKHIDPSKYISIKESMDQYYEQYKPCFNMFDYYNESANDYINAYYSFSNDKQRSQSVSGMIKQFKELAIPDLLIQSSRQNKSQAVYNYINTNFDSINESGLLGDWLLETNNSIPTKLANDFYQKSSKKLVTECFNRNYSIYQEAAILGKEDAEYDYTDEEIEAIKKMISYKEWAMVCETESTKRNKLQKEIYRLYEALDGVDEDSSDLVDMKPTNEAAPWIVNTRDKKTGQAASYIRRNHDYADWGETDDDEPKKSNDEEEPSLDDYKRPSADKTSEPDIPDEDDDSPESLSKQHQNIQNYYYYTYNNSLNKNSHSFNKDQSIRDRHDRYDKHSDDHSTNKHTNSHNNNRYQDDDEDDFRAVESAPWELNIEPPFYTEGNDQRPQSDHPVRDTFMDIDRNMVSKQQAAKQRVQNVKGAVRAVTKPIKRAASWITNMINEWKDLDETRAKEKLADPYARRNLFTAIRNCIVAGSLFKAGLLFNPIFLVLGATRFIGKNKRDMRLRNEMIGELKTEMQVVDEKIRDADSKGDYKAKYQLMRFKNELNKKMLRCADNKKGIVKVI